MRILNKLAILLTCICIISGVSSFGSSANDGINNGISLCDNLGDNTIIKR